MQAPLNSEDTGGPDDYGYTWDDGFAYSWEITATDTGITGDDVYGLVNIGFSFPFYEQTWSEVYVTTNGILIFGDPDDGYCGGFGFPSPSWPNNVIAPFSEDLTVGSGYNFGGIFTASGGSAPNRYFVIEWHDVTLFADDFGDEYTFQVILREDGDIVFQYSEISDTWWYYTVGIEDSRGLDGLEYPNEIYNGLAVRFYRRDPMARIQLYPLFQSAFVSSGENLEYNLTVLNTAIWVQISYDLTTTSVWPLTLYASDGITPVTDTDGDGVVDTGHVAQGASTTIIAKVQVPGLTNVGDRNNTLVTATSSLNPAKNKTATIEASVPANFAQVFSDDAEGAMSIYLVQPHS